MKDFRVLITEKCNANCPTCFNKNIRNGSEMSYDDFVKICDYLADEGEVKRLKIMGGEPTVHPAFCDIVEYAQSKFAGVHIFTNAINDQIEKVNLRASDSVIYNVSCLPRDFKESRMVMDCAGGRMFETQISSDCNVNHIKDVLSRARQVLDSRKMGIALTLNCIEDIFTNKKIIIEKWNEIAEFIHQDLHMEHNIDHNIPFCFFMGSSMKIKTNRSLCSIKCAGLITAKMQLQYCNQSQDILDEIKYGERFIPFEILENRLKEYYYKKMAGNSEKMCRDCVLFERKCNGGCFMHKDFIKREAIIEHSDLPFM